MLFLFGTANVVYAHFHHLSQFQLAQIQSLANAGARTPINPHQSFTDKMVEEALFPPGASPPHINNLHTPNGKF